MSTTLNVQEAKTHLSRYLTKVEQGEIIVICRHNKPVAEIRAIPSEPEKKQRVIGLCKGQFELGPEFFEPLPPEVLAAFNGQ